MPRVTHPKQGGHVASPKQGVLLKEFLITVVAVEWFFTSVNPFMHSQVVLLDEFLITVVAIEWLFSNALLSFWPNFLSQWWQLNGFFTSVKPFMHSQVVLLDEFLV